MNERNRSFDVLDEQTIDQSPSIVAEATNNNRRFFAASDLASLSVDELWKFHAELEPILTAKIAVEVRELERRIDRLHDANRRSRTSTRQAVPPRRPHPPRLPEYQNLSPP